MSPKNKLNHIIAANIRPSRNTNFERNTNYGFCKEPFDGEEFYEYRFWRMFGENQCIYNKTSEVNTKVL